MPDVLPAAGFLTFRACTRLPAATAELVDRVWRTGFPDIRAWVPRHIDYSDPQATAITLALPLSLHLAKTFHRCESEGEALVRLRATQAALLHFGLLLNHRPGLNTGPATGRLRSYLIPSRAAVINRQLDPAYAAARHHLPAVPLRPQHRPHLLLDRRRAHPHRPERPRPLPAHPRRRHPRPRARPAGSARVSDLPPHHRRRRGFGSAVPAPTWRPTRQEAGGPRHARPAEASPPRTPHRL